jgi:hypothetical protein
MHPSPSSFAKAKLLSEAVLLTELLSSLSASSTTSVGLTQTHSVQTLGSGSLPLLLRYRVPL